MNIHYAVIRMPISHDQTFISCIYRYLYKFLPEFHTVHGHEAFPAVTTFFPEYQYQDSCEEGHGDNGAKYKQCVIHDFQLYLVLYQYRMESGSSDVGGSSGLVERVTVIVIADPNNKVDRTV